VAIILSVICFSFCEIIATERKTTERQYNSHRKKNKWQTI
jgi:hypothetical protein